MLISEMARNLLQNAGLDALQQLPYHQLLSEGTRQEIVEVFKQRAPDLHESTGPVVHDALCLSTLAEACVVSSGQVYSQASVEDLFRAAGSGEVRCPLTREVLTRDIAGPGQHYVLLPKLDEAIQLVRQLRTAVRRRVAETRRFFGASLGMPPIGEDREYEQRHQAQVIGEPIGSVQLKVTQGVLTLIFNTNRLPVVCQTLLNDYLYAELPKGKADSGESYTMDPLCFGRCWQKTTETVFTLDLWFPSASYLPNGVRTFGDRHLLEMQAKIERLLNIKPPEIAGEVDITHSVATLACDVEVPVIENAAATFTQMFLCAVAFLDYTQKFAQRLKFEIKDEVESSALPASETRVSEIGVFGSTANVGSSSPLSSAGLRNS